jgi:hypothetical protein
VGRTLAAVLPGDPFLTDDLDQLRAVQRGQLRAIPAWVVERQGQRFPPAPAVPEADLAMIEQLLRRLAADAFVELEVARWDQLGGEEAAALLGPLRETAQELGTADSARRILDDLVEDLEVATREIPARFTEDEIHVATRFILFAAWADELAGDYLDPRFGEAAR